MTGSSNSPGSTMNTTESETTPQDGATTTSGERRSAERACWDLDGDGIATLRLAPEGAELSGPLTLTETRLESFDTCVREIADAIAAGRAIRGVVVTGPHERMFAAGADVQAIGGIVDPAEGERAARRGQEIFERLEGLPVPTVAALGGPCLGGGLELALACTRRVAVDDPGTKIGLPEVKLGILPGFGGTQRLARLVGLPKSLELILQGKMLDARRALRQGVVDRAVAPERLLTAARQEIERLVAKPNAAKRKLRGFAWWASFFPPLRGYVARKVRKTLETGPAARYPAPKAALECVLAAFRGDRAGGFQREARELGRLIVTKESKALVRLFFLTERSKKLGKAEGARAVDNAVVVGGGIMGAGIAGLFALRGVRTRLCDLVPDNLAAAKARLQKDLDKKTKRRRMQKHEAMAAQDRLAVSAAPGDLRRTDLWLEAVPEDLGLKQKIVRGAIDSGLRDDAIIATNTSSLSITELARGIDHPERVVGIHFFNPPEKMPLVEIVRGEQTSDAAVATAARLAIGLGKFPVVVRDRAGFLVNRCLAPYLDEAARLMLEGVEPERIDEVAKTFGFPMGPARLLDEVGLDVAAKVGEVLAEAFAHMRPAPLCRALADAGHLGRKTGGCFYGRDGKREGPGRAVLTALRADQPAPKIPPTFLADTEIRDRLVLPMVAEAWRCLADGTVANEDDLDLGLVFGIGFPPFRGGLMAWVRREGIDAITARMRTCAERFGERFAPPPAPAS
jgi:3-hydroxyacyl-CoA dehydrogenase/enoyl-CoA hydratase/3-hydroxybutyryl-CoA epimerase